MRHNEQGAAVCAGPRLGHGIRAGVITRASRAQHARGLAGQRRHIPLPSLVARFGGRRAARGGAEAGGTCLAVSWKLECNARTKRGLHARRVEVAEGSTGRVAAHGMHGLAQAE